MKQLTLFITCLLFFSACTETVNDTNESASIQIAVAANMQFTMDSIAVLFEQETGIVCDVSSNSSGMLTAQIEKGAPFDVFVSANMRYPNKLVESGFGETPVVYAFGQLALVYKKDKEYSSVQEVLNSKKIKRIAVADPKTAPYGMAGMEFLENSNSLIRIEDKVVYGESVGQVNQYLKTGAVDAALTSNSFITKFGDEFNFIEVDPSFYSNIDQGMLILKHGRKNHPEESEKFIDFLSSESCKDVLKHFGYRIK